MNFSFEILFDSLSVIIQRYEINTLLVPREPGQVLYQSELTVILVALVIGLLWCFAGHLMTRFWAGILGLALGFVAGTSISSLLIDNGIVVLIVAIVFGLAFGFFSVRIYLLGAFFVTLLFVFGFVAILFDAQSVLLLVVSIVVALLIACISLKFPTPILVITTAVCGAFLTGSLLRVLINFNHVITIVAIVILTLGGVMSQFVFENGKRKRENLYRAYEIKESVSSNNDVERARNWMEDLEAVPQNPERKVIDDPLYEGKLGMKPDVDTNEVEDAEEIEYIEDVEDAENIKDIRDRKHLGGTNEKNTNGRNRKKKALEAINSEEDFEDIIEEISEEDFVEIYEGDLEETEKGGSPKSSSDFIADKKRIEAEKAKRAWINQIANEKQEKAKKNQNS